ncbi:MAG: hypothetical protein SF187_14695 [Deltaproteobacteria bacterium]|nr:hypothetical protein [Deltaproteobacteria bacterium]
MQALFLAALLAAAAPTTTTTVETFDTNTPPVVDPVFADPLALRRSIDEFLSLQGEMEQVRDTFAISIHETLGQLPDRRASRCPPQMPELYRRSYAAGSQYLKLGQKLRELYRSIARADAVGDGIALTPDYRLKAKQAGVVFAGLLRDYREMRVAFHDQLATELRYAGCAVQGWLNNTAGPSSNANMPDTNDPEEWNIDRSLEPAHGDAALPNVPPAQVTRPKGKLAATVPPASSSQAIWMTIDNAKCPRATRMAIDGVPLGEVPPKKRVSVRARAGARDLCLLPEGDARVCGEAGTLRRVYLYEGLTLTVHCGAVP